MLEELVDERNRCKLALDQAQEAVNRRILADSPAKRGDVIQDEDGTIFRVVKARVKTICCEDGTLVDRLMFEFQKKQNTRMRHGWARPSINTTELTARVLEGKAKVVRHAQYKKSFGTLKGTGDVNEN